MLAKSLTSYKLLTPADASDVRTLVEVSYHVRTFSRIRQLTCSAPPEHERPDEAPLICFMKVFMSVLLCVCWSGDLVAEDGGKPPYVGIQADSSQSKTIFTRLFCAVVGPFSSST